MKISLSASLVEHILTTGTMLPKKSPSISHTFDKIASAVKIPIFEKNEISKITNDIINGKSLYEALDAVNFAFPCNLHFLENLPNIKFRTKEARNFISVFIFNSFLSWFSLYDRQEISENIEIILKLLQITFSSSFSQVGEPCFMSTLLICIENKDYDLLHREMNIIIDFLNNFPHHQIANCIVETFFADENLFKKDEYDNFIHALMDIQLRKGDSFYTQEAIEKFVKIIKTTQFSFRHSTFNFLSSFNTDSLHTLLKPYIETIGQRLFAEISNEKPLEIAKQKKEATRFEFKQSTELLMGFSEKKTFINGLSEEEVQTLETTNDLLSFFKEDVFLIVQSIIVLANKSIDIQKIIASSFIVVIDPLKSGELFFSIYSLYLVFISAFKGNLSETDVPITILQSKVFDPNVTVFSHEGDFSVIGSIRSVAIDCLCSFGVQSLYMLLLTCVNTPLLLGEVLSRLSKKTSVIAQYIIPRSIFTKFLSQIASFYKIIDFSETQQSVIDEIECARTAYLVFIKHLVNEQVAFANLFLDTLFVQTTFSLLYEDNIQTYPLSLLSFLLNSHVSNEVVFALNNIFFLSSSSLPDEKHAKLLSNLLKTLNAGITTKREISNSFESLCPIVLKTMLIQGAPIYLFESASTFLALMSPYFTFDSSITEYQNSPISNESEEYNKALYPKIVQLLAGDLVSAISPSFIVKQPVAIKIMFSIFYNTKMMKDAAEFADNLCKFSPENIAAFASIDICSFIIALLEADKKSNKLDEKTVELMLSIYSSVATIATSAQNVIKFISLLAPIDETHISPYQQLYFNTLNFIAVTSLNEPKSYLALNGESVSCPVPDIYQEQLTFSFTCWIYLVQNPTEYKPTLFMLSSGSIDEISLFASGTTIYFHQTNGEFETQGKIIENVSCNTWHFFGCTMIPDGDRNVLYYTLDTEETNFMKVSRLDFSSKFKEPVFQVGGGCGIDVSIPSKITNCGLFKLLYTEEQTKIIEAGIKETQKFPKKPVCFLSDFKKNNNKNGFVDILIERCGVASLLPLFSMNNLKFADEKPFIMQFESALSLLRNVLLYSSEAQLSFFHARGFYIFSHLLDKYWSDKFSLKIYHQLTELLCCLTVDMLQQHLFDTILTNVPFFMKLSDSIHLRILKVWSGSLFQSFPTLARNMRPVSDLLNMLRTYYYFEQIEGEPIDTSINRSKGLNVKKCRAQLLIILTQYLNESMSEADFFAISDFMINCKDMQQVDEISAILIRNIMDFPESFTFSLETPHFILLIREMIARGEQSAIEYAMSIYVAASNKNLISDEFFKLSCWSLLLDFPKIEQVQQINEFSLALLHNQPIVLPICCFLAKVTNDKKVLDHFLLSSYEESNIFFVTWIFLIFDDLSNDQQVSLVDFILTNYRSMFGSIIAEINSAFGNFPEFCEKIKMSLFVGFAAIKDMQEAEINDFLQTSCKEIFNSSIFRLSAGENMTQFTANGFINLFSTPKERCFGLKFNNDGKWINKDLAILSLNVFERSASRKFLPFDLAISAFLQRTDFPSVAAHLSRIKLSETEVNQYQDFISLINYHTLVSGKLSNQVQTNCRVTDEAYHNIEETLLEFCNTTFEHDDFSKISSLAKTLLEEMNTVSYSISTNDLKQRIESITETGTKLWRKLWNTLTVERAPWSTMKANDKDAFELDTTPCFGFIPVKTKRRRKQFEDNGEKAEGTIKIAFQAFLIPSNQQTIFEIRSKTAVLGETLINTNEITHIFATRGVKSRIQIFTCTGKYYYFYVKWSPDKLIEAMSDTDMKHIKHICVSNSANCVNEFTEKWVHNQMSTFEYISILNILKGNSYVDEENKPVFPKPPEFKEKCSVDEYMKGTILEQYELRKKLEEDDEIDAWLSKFTGSTHPKRGIRIKVYHSDLHINLEIQHLASAIIDNANQKVPTVFVLSFDGTITAFQFPLQHLNVVRSTPRKTRFSSIRNVLSMSNKFIIYEPESPDVVEIDAKTAKSITIETEFTRIDHIAVDENLTAVCGNDTLVSVFIDDEQLFELQLFRDSPSCIAVSESFHAIVCCTNEGIVLIYSATDGSLAHVIDIGRCQIRNVCITKNFGIICCHTFKDGVQARHSLIFLTINGEMISELEINEAVSMSTFSSAEGADYIVYVQERGRIVVVNAATQENEVINRKSNGKRVLGFVYSSSISSIQIVTSDGVFYSLPVSV